MKVEQYVMAYGAEQDRLRAILPVFSGLKISLPRYILLISFF